MFALYLLCVRLRHQLLPRQKHLNKNLVYSLSCCWWIQRGVKVSTIFFFLFATVSIGSSLRYDKAGAGSTLHLISLGREKANRAVSAELADTRRHFYLFMTGINAATRWLPVEKQQRSRPRQKTALIALNIFSVVALGCLTESLWNTSTIPTSTFKMVFNTQRISKSDCSCNAFFFRSHN